MLLGLEDVTPSLPQLDFSQAAFKLVSTDQVLSAPKMQHTLFPQADGPLGPSTKVCPAMPPTQTDSPCSPAEFEEPRVIDLWDLAQSANFTEKELESFRVRKLGGKAVSPSVGVSNGIGFSVPFPHRTMRSCFCPFLPTLASAVLVILVGSHVVAGGHTPLMPTVSVLPVYSMVGWSTLLCAGRF